MLLRPTSFLQRESWRTSCRRKVPSRFFYQGSLDELTALGATNPIPRPGLLWKRGLLEQGVSRCPFLGLLLLDPENSREQICYETLGSTHGDFLGTLLV